MEDSQGEVKGVQIDRKEQDEFKIFVHQLTEKIRPAVDLSNREDVIYYLIIDICSICTCIKQGKIHRKIRYKNNS